MKIRTYNNLTLLFLFVCSFLLVFCVNGFLPADAASVGIAEDSRTLHLYTSVFGEDTSISLEDASVGVGQSVVGSRIQDIFNQLFTILFTISGTLMVVLIAVHGTKMIYAQAGGNVNAFGDEKKHLKDIAIGAGILLLSWVILNFVDPDLLRPKFFQSIIRLREVTDGGDVLTNDITVDGNQVTFEEDTGTLRITACPVIEKGFKKRLRDIRTSLIGKPVGHEDSGIETAYMILYSTAVNRKVYFYDAETEKSWSSNDIKNAANIGTEISVRHIVCDNQKLYKTGDDAEAGKNSFNDIKLSDNHIDTVALFPLVFVVETRESENPDDSSKTGEFEETLRSWRGKPWRHSPRLDKKDALVSAAKEHIKPVVDIEAVYDSALRCPKVVSFSLPRIETGDFERRQGDTFGYKIAPSAGIKSNTPGYGDDVNNIVFPEGIKMFLTFSFGVSTENIFSITPVLRSERGLSTCFKVKTDNRSCLFAIQRQKPPCIDDGLDKDSTVYKEDVASTVKQLLVPTVFDSDCAAAKTALPANDGNHSVVYTFLVDGYKGDDWNQILSDFSLDTNTVGSRGLGGVSIKTSNIEGGGASVRAQVSGSDITTEYDVRIVYGPGVERFCLSPVVSIRRRRANKGVKIELHKNCFEVGKNNTVTCEKSRNP